MVGRRAVCGVGLGVAAALAGCTPKRPAVSSPTVISAAPNSAAARRRTSTDPDTNRILEEIGETLTQLTVYPDRIHAATENGRNLLSRGGSFAPAPEQEVMATHTGAFPADAFLVATVRRLVQSNRGAFGVVSRTEGNQVMLQVKRADSFEGSTVRCVLPPDREIPAYDYQQEQGVEQGLSELRPVQRTDTFAIGLRHDAHEGTWLELHGRAGQQDLVWSRDQFRPLTRKELLTPRSTEPLDPTRVTTRGLLRLADSLTDRSGDLVALELLALTRNGKSKIEFTAVPENSPSVVGDADLNGRITRIQ